jgi:putative membrane protein
MKYLLWLLKAAIFFTLFAFALNNQHDATVYFFFGTHWRAPLVLVVLAAFAGGLVVGALGMLPGWWKHRAAAAAQGPSGTDTIIHHGTDSRVRSVSGTVHLRHRPPRRTSTWTLIPAGC